MYIDKIYTKLYSNKDWNGLNALINEMRSFTRGIEKYKDFYEPGYDLIKAYRHKAAQNLVNKKHEPGYNPDMAFKYIAEAHDEAQKDPEIVEMGRKVSSDAGDELHRRFRESINYDPHDLDTWSKYHDNEGFLNKEYYHQFEDFKDSELQKELDKMKTGVPRSKTDLGIHEFDAFNPYSGYLDHHDDPDSRLWGSIVEPNNMANAWNKRKEREYEDAVKKSDEVRDAELAAAGDDAFKAIPKATLWNKVTGKYGKAKKLANDEYNKDTKAAWDKWKKSRDKAEKDRENKAKF